MRENDRLSIAERAAALINVIKSDNSDDAKRLKVLELIREASHIPALNEPVAHHRHSAYFQTDGEQEGNYNQVEIDTPFAISAKMPYGPCLFGDFGCSN